MMVDYSLQRRWIIALALRAMRRMAEDKNCSDIERLRFAASMLVKLPFQATSHD